MRRTIRITLYAALVASAAACSSDGQVAPAVPAAVEALRASLGAFTSPALAASRGYDAALTDCMSNGDIGAMGRHVGNPALIDGNVDPLRPEVLIYEPGVNGASSLVGVEFIVPFAITPRNGTPPVLFGQRFTPDEVFGLWTLHVWTHRENPSGLFAPWNPRVHC
jgi:hypothetical protein